MIESSVRINEPSVLHESIDGEVIVLHLETGTYYDLRDVAAEIWRGIQRSPSVAEIVESLAQRYGAARETVEQAVREFIDELRAEALIVLDAVRAPVAPGLSGAAVSAAVGLPPLPFSLPRLNRFTDLRSVIVS